jgi:hypothetical protein
MREDEEIRTRELTEDILSAPREDCGRQPALLGKLECTQSRQAGSWAGPFQKSGEGTRDWTALIRSDQIRGGTTGPWNRGARRSWMGNSLGNFAFFLNEVEIMTEGCFVVILRRVLSANHSGVLTVVVSRVPGVRINSFLLWPTASVSHANGRLLGAELTSGISLPIIIICLESHKAALQSKRRLRWLLARNKLHSFYHSVCAWAMIAFLMQWREIVKKRNNHTTPAVWPLSSNREIPTDEEAHDKEQCPYRKAPQRPRPPDS